MKSWEGLPGWSKMQFLHLERDTKSSQAKTLVMKMELRFCRNRPPGRQMGSPPQKTKILKENLGSAQTPSGQTAPFWGGEWPPNSKNVLLSAGKVARDSGRVQPLLDKDGKTCPENSGAPINRLCAQRANDK